MSHKVRTVIVELEHPIDSDDDYLVNGIADEHYGVGRELIRCNDCKYSYEGCTKYVCERTFHEFTVEPEGYCAWAERRADNG